MLARLTLSRIKDVNGTEMRDMFQRISASVPNLLQINLRNMSSLPAISCQPYLGCSTLGNPTQLHKTLQKDIAKKISKDKPGGQGDVYLVED